MPEKKHNIPKHLRLGKTGASQEAKIVNGVSKGQVQTNLQDISWTPTKLTLTIIALCIPYLIAVIGAFAAGAYMFGFIFIGLGLLVVGIYLLLRYIERSDF